MQRTRTVKAGELAARPVVTIGPNDSILDAATLMRSEHVGALVVVDQRGGARYPIGILTDRDIVIGVLAQGVSDLATIFVKDTMPRALVTALSDDDIFAVIDKMAAHGVRRVPVVSNTGELVGIVTQDDLVRQLAKEMCDFTRALAHQRVLERTKRI